MATYRVNKTKDFTTMSNYHLKDKNLSLKAKGLLSVMLSLNDEWKYSVDGLCSISKENKTAINSALKELKDSNYLMVSKNRQSNGTFEYIYDIYEKPQTEKPDTENPYMDNPPMENPYTENQLQLNTNNKYINNKDTNNKIDIIKENIKEIFDYWNSCNIIQHAKLTDDMKRLLKTRLNEYDVEQLKECISHYSEAYHSEYEYCQFKWSILTFFKQKNAYLDFMEDGSKWNNYLRWKNENNISYNFDTTNEHQRELRYYTNLKNTNKQKYDEELEQLQYWKPELYEYIYNQLENGGFEEL